MRSVSHSVSGWNWVSAQSSEFPVCSLVSQTTSCKCWVCTSKGRRNPPNPPTLDNPASDRRNARFGVNGFNYSLTSTVVSSSSSVVFSLITACLFCRYPKITLPFIERNIIKSNSGFVTSSIRADRFRPHLHKSVFIFKHIHTRPHYFGIVWTGRNWDLRWCRHPCLLFDWVLSTTCPSPIHHISTTLHLTISCLIQHR